MLLLELLSIILKSQFLMRFQKKKTWDWISSLKKQLHKIIITQPKPIFEKKIENIISRYCHETIPGIYIYIT